MKRVKRWDATGVDCEMAEVFAWVEDKDCYVLASDYAKLRARFVDLRLKHAALVNQRKAKP